MTPSDSFFFTLRKRRIYKRGEKKERKIRKGRIKNLQTRILIERKIKLEKIEKCKIQLTRS